MPNVEFRNSRGLRLVGDLVSTGSRAVVVLAHGFTGDRMHRNRFPRLMRHLASQGLSSLSFDFSGCGESDDDTLTVAKEADDLRSAIDFARGHGFGPVALYGQSLGSLVCLRAREPSIVTMALAGALTGPMRYDWPSYFSPEQMRELADTGRATVLKEAGPRRAVVVEAQMLREIEETDQAALLAAVRCPVLLIHGDGDEEERDLLALSRRAMPLLPEGSQLEVIAGANHRFEGQEERLMEAAGEWLVGHLAGNGSRESIQVTQVPPAQA